MTKRRLRRSHVQWSVSVTPNHRNCKLETRRRTAPSPHFQCRGTPRLQVGGRILRPGTGVTCILPPRGTETRCSLQHVSHLYLTARAVHKAVHRDRPASDPLRCRGGGRVAGRVTKPKYWASAAHSRVARTQSGGSSVSPLCSRHARCASVSLAIESCRHGAPEGCANVVGERHEPVRRITAEGGLSRRGLAVQN